MTTSNDTTTAAPPPQRITIGHTTTAAWPADKPPVDDNAAMELHGMDLTIWRIVKRTTIVNPLCTAQVLDTINWESL